MSEETDYNIFFEFIRNYSGKKFRDINNLDHFMVRLNRVLHNGRQFIWVFDIISFELLFTSQQVTEFFGIDTEKYDLSQNLSRTHPLDMRRRSAARANLIETGNNLYINKAGTHLSSSNFRIRNREDDYINVLVQCYIFYTGASADTVYILGINTMLPDFLSRKIKKRHYHWYSGNDMAHFRYPDEDLLLIGSNLSERELEVLKYIHMGMSSKDIAGKLSLSPHTVNTHRRNILKKTGKSAIGEVIYDIESIRMI